MLVAIYGCGQLAGMLAMEGLTLGHTFVFIADPGEDTACVEGKGDIFRRSGPTLDEDITQALKAADVMTVEREQIDLDVLKACAGLVPLYPPLEAIATARDRWLEKNRMVELDIPVAPFFDVMDATAHSGGADNGYIVKSCRSGYDGKHQYRVGDVGEIAGLELGERVRGDWIVEEIIPFEFEFSVIGARGLDGSIVLYPPTENLHIGGILRRSLTPTPRVTPALREMAEQYLTRLLEDMNHVGVLAMECFAVGEHCLVNELAPRVHNSGHWSLFDSGASQFANHIRAITGMPLVTPGFDGCRGMLNLIGIDRDEASFGGFTDVQPMRYPKTARPGRKLGHINVRRNDFDALFEAVSELEQDVYGERSPR